MGRLRGLSRLPRAVQTAARWTRGYECVVESGAGAAAAAGGGPPDLLHRCRGVDAAGAGFGDSSRNRVPAWPVGSRGALRRQQQGGLRFSQQCRQRLRSCCAGTSSQGDPLTLRIIHVTDVYMLDNFPSLKTLIAEKKAELPPGSKCISVLTGDFLAPYLLSSVDKGAGMIKMLNITPIDYVTWGNHEADLEHSEVMACEAAFKGIFINSNMRDHAACFRPGSRQRESVVVELRQESDSSESGDPSSSSSLGPHVRRVGLLGLLLNNPGLYPKGAFGGATIEDPWEVLAELEPQLRDTEGCDLVLPLTHMYQAQDEHTARAFPGRFPLILGGHDHDPMDVTFEGTGTRLLKPGQDAAQAYVVDITWEDAARGSRPSVEAELVDVRDWKADKGAQAEMERAVRVLDAMRRTSLMFPDEKFRPLTSAGVRRKSTTMGAMLATEVRKALLRRDPRGIGCDACVLKGGAMRAEADYGDQEHVTLATLEAELPRNQPVHLVRVPGDILAQGLRWNRMQAGAAWLQVDDEIEEGPGGELLRVAGEPLDKQRKYTIASFPGLWCTPGCPISTYLNDCRYPERRPEQPEVPVQALLLSSWATQAWEHIWQILDADGDGVITADELAALDADCDGELCSHDLAEALGELGFMCNSMESAFLDEIICVAGDIDCNGKLSLEEINARRPACAGRSSWLNAGEEEEEEEEEEEDGGGGTAPASVARSLLEDQEDKAEEKEVASDEQPGIEGREGAPKQEMVVSSRSRQSG